MRSAGFPCRITGCDRSFQVTDQSSMDALTKASAARTAHEIEAHDYRHVPLTDEPRRSPFVPVKPRGAGQKAT